jgi:hypothetical protein
MERPQVFPGGSIGWYERSCRLSARERVLCSTTAETVSLPVGSTIRLINSLHARSRVGLGLRPEGFAATDFSASAAARMIESNPTISACCRAAPRLSSSPNLASSVPIEQPIASATTSCFAPATTRCSTTGAGGPRRWQHVCFWPWLCENASGRVISAI